MGMLEGNAAHTKMTFETAARDLAAAQPVVVNSTSCEMEAKLWQVEQHLEETVQKLERLCNEAHGDKGWESKLEQHEVRLTGLRTRLDAQEEHYSHFDERVRQDWEARFEQLHKVVQEGAARH